MALALEHLRGCWSILGVGEQYYDHHKRGATKLQRQVNRLLGYKVRWSQSRPVQLIEHNMGDLLTEETNLNHIESLTRYNKKTGRTT
jgi:hypothetical protein